MLSKNIKHLRKKLGLTQAKLAESIGKPRAWVAKVETNRIRIYADDLVLLSQALGVSEADLLRSDLSQPPCDDAA